MPEVLCLAYNRKTQCGVKRRRSAVGPQVSRTAFDLLSVVLAFAFYLIRLLKVKKVLLRFLKEYRELVFPEFLADSYFNDKTNTS